MCKKLLRNKCLLFEIILGSTEKYSTSLPLSLSLYLCVCFSLSLYIFSELGQQALFKNILLNKCLLCLSITSFLHFPDAAAFVATSPEEVQVTVNQFAVESKAFGLNTNLKKKEVIHQTPPCTKQIRGAREPRPVHQFTNTPIKFELKDLKYVNLFPYLRIK